MKLITKYNVLNNTPLLDYKKNILTIGSCFSEYIGQKLLESQFNIHKNPLGTLYHPITIFNHLKNSISKNPTKMLEPYYINKEEHYFNYYCHSSIFGKTKQQYSSIFSSTNDKLAEVIKKNGVIIITLGTAFGYSLKEKKDIVIGNCHKQVKALFNRQLYSVTDIINAFKSMYDKFNSKNFKPIIIFTLSPIRHLKDGMVDNFLSKATCLVAISEIMNFYDDIYYFPAYEIMNDELRDYRFYAEDLIHPNALAQKIIWQYFIDQFMDSTIIEVIEKWNKMAKTINHKPRIVNSTYVALLKNTLEKLDEFAPFLNVDKIKEVVIEKINGCEKK